jgi:hypothetical protein
MLEQTATCPAATCSNRLQHVHLQHARTGGNMSGSDILEQAATCPAATCSIRLQHHAVFCYNYGLLDVILVVLPTV